jgi:hypothetical protein
LETLVKYGKYGVGKFVYICIVRAKIGAKFPALNASINVQNSRNSQGYISHILQYFAAKLRTITNFKMPFRAVSADFELRA